MADVFISYSRRDQDFVRRLHGALAGAGREVWVDWEGIPPSAKWMDEVKAAIDAADAFVFVVSPDSAASPVCRDEAEHAMAVGKRIVPVVWRDTPEHDLPDAISAHNWLTLREGDDFDAGFARLLAALDTDLEWVKEHTRLVTRAREWEASGKERSRLLRGRDLGRAEQAIAQAQRDPRPTPLQTSYVLASRAAERRGARIRTAVLSGGLVVALILAGFALLQRNAAEQNAAAAEQQRQVAEEQRGEAETQRSAAEQQATLARARELTAAAGRVLSTDPELSVLLAREAVGLVSDDRTDRGLREALQASMVRGRYVGQQGEIKSVEIAGNGERLVTASSDGTVDVWDHATRRLLTTVRVPGTVVEHADIAPDGSRFAAVSDDGAVAVWATDGTVLARWRGHADRAVDVAFSPDGSRLLTAGLDGAATLWDPSTGRRLVSVPAVPDDLMVSAAFNADGTRLITSNADLTVRVWDAASGAELAQYVGPSRQPFAAASSPNGVFVAVAAQDETARIWDASTGAQLQVLTHGGEVYSVSFSPDGNQLATASSDGLVRIWDVQTGELTAQLAGHDGAVNEATFAPDGMTVISVGRDGTIREWAVAVATAGVHYTGHFGSTYTGDVSPDGARVTTVGAGDMTAIVYETSSGKQVATVRGHDAPISSVRFSSDGRTILTGSYDGTARLWDATTGSQLMRFDGNTALVYAAALTSDGSLAATAGSDHTVRVWDASGAARWDHELADEVADVTFSPDGGTLYAGDATGALVAFDPLDGTERARVQTGSGVSALAVSPDGTRIAVLGRDARVRTWDSAGLTPILDLPATSGYGWQVRYSPDGHRLVTGGDDGAVHVWDAGTGERLADLRLDPRDAFVGQFLPDGTDVLVTTRISQAILVRCDLCGTTDDISALADDRVTRDFTADERSVLLHEQSSAPPSTTAAPEPAPSLLPEPLPSPATTPIPGLCPPEQAPCDVPVGRFSTLKFGMPFSFTLASHAMLNGESGTAVAFQTDAGDQLTFADGRAYSGSDGRTLVALPDTAAGIEAYFRGRPWMHIGPDRELVAGGRRARLVQITSDVEQELPYGAVGGNTFAWGIGETLDLAIVDGPAGPLIVFGDRVSDTPQAEFDAQFDAAVRSIRFR